MESFETIHEMRKTLLDMETKLTPYSGKSEHQRYLDSLCHYKKIMNSYIIRQNQELDIIINKTNDLIRNFTIVSNDEIKRKVLDGRC